MASCSRVLPTNPHYQNMGLLGRELQSCALARYHLHERLGSEASSWSPIECRRSERPLSADLADHL
eukprot:6776245-Prorocentrum_lima.AAC.1